MSFQLVELGSIANFINGFAFKPEHWEESGKPIIRIQNLTNPSKPFNYSSMEVPEKYHVTCGDLLVSWSATLDVFEWEREDALLNQHIFKIEPNYEKVNKDYLRYALRDAISAMLKFTRGSTMKHVNRGDFLGTKIPLPPLETQKKIAAVLEKADQLRKDCQQMEQELNSLAQSVFIDMFGDPVTNPKGWDVTYLQNHGVFKNGLNFTKDDSGTKIKYLGVGDFKSLASINGTDSLGQINVNTLPANDYLLHNGDLVFVRSNGNKALVGRCISIYPDGEALTFSGFCIRYRIEDGLIEPEYLNYMLRTSSMKKSMLEGGQGANIQNINQKILSSIAIPIPPKDEQLVFCKAIESYRLSAEQMSKHKVEINYLFNSLMQKAFKGELNL